MSSVTTFQGRRCTKVRRNATAPAGSDTVTTLTTTSAAASSSTLTTQTTTTRHSTTLVDATLASESTTSTKKTSTTTTETTSSTSTTLQLSTTITDVTTSVTSEESEPSTTVAPVAATTQAQSEPTTSTPPPEPAESTAAPDDPDVQASTQPNEQNTLPAVSTASTSTTSADAQSSAALDTVDPMAIPISEVTSVMSPFAVAQPTATVGRHSSIAAAPSSSATAAAASHSSPSSEMATAAGAVTGVLGGLVFIGLLFFLFRKLRKNGRFKLRRRSRGSMMLDDGRGDGGGPRSSSELIGWMNRFAAMLDVRKIIKMRTPSVYEGPTPNPAFSNPGSRTASPPMSESRRRSMSAPATTFRERLQAAAAALPTISIPRKAVTKGFTVERRPSATDVAPQIPPMFQRDNGSVSSIARAVYSPEADDDLNPFRDPDPSAPLRIVNSTPSRLGTPSVTPMINDGVVFNPMYKVPATTNTPQSLYQRPRSQTLNPFADPSDNIGTAVPLGSNRPRNDSEYLPLSRSGSIQPRQFNSSAVDQPRLLPPQQNSIDPRIKSVSSMYSTPDDSVVEKVPPLRVPPNGYLPAVSSPALQTPRVPVPAYKQSPGMAYQPSPSLRPLPSAMSGNTFAFNFGEPGPTRPNTFLNDMGTPGGAVTPGANTRMSDPFDLDNPEVLGFMRNDSNESWRNYRTASTGRSASTNNWPMGPTIRSVRD